jgi:heme-degrading monooxygenase HmoA
MIVVLFRSRLTADAGDDYGAMAQEMLETAQSMPGFVDVKSYAADDGERLTIVRWQDEATMKAWREHPRHRVAQGLGIDKWYSSYSLEIAEVVRESKFNRESV